MSRCAKEREALEHRTTPRRRATAGLENEKCVRSAGSVKTSWGAFTEISGALLPQEVRRSRFDPFRGQGLGGEGVGYSVPLSPRNYD